jgi:hypothetical protein
MQGEEMQGEEMQVSRKSLAHAKAGRAEWTLVLTTFVLDWMEELYRCVQKGMGFQ